MEISQKLKQARLDAGLSQKALCGDRITRNMLSQIENGSARPSMDTLRYLAGQLGKPISYFLTLSSILYLYSSYQGNLIIISCIFRINMILLAYIQAGQHFHKSIPAPAKQRREFL